MAGRPCGGYYGRGIQGETHRGTIPPSGLLLSYHPNYISSLLSKRIGKKFSEIVLEKRMDRAAILIKGTDLSVEEISSMVGYSDTSNFYKAFREYYGVSPREYAKQQKNI